MGTKSSVTPPEQAVEAPSNVNANAIPAAAPPTPRLLTTAKPASPSDASEVSSHFGSRARARSYGSSTGSSRGDADTDEDDVLITLSSAEHSQHSASAHTTDNEGSNVSTGITSSIMAPSPFEYAHSRSRTTSALRKVHFDQASPHVPRARAPTFHPRGPATLQVPDTPRPEAASLPGDVSLNSDESFASNRAELDGRGNGTLYETVHHAAPSAYNHAENVNADVNPATQVQYPLANVTNTLTVQPPAIQLPPPSGIPEAIQLPPPSNIYSPSTSLPSLSSFGSFGSQLFDPNPFSASSSLDTINLPPPSSASFNNNNSASCVSPDQNQGGQQQQDGGEDDEVPNVYVNGLPPHLPEQALHQLCAPYGLVRSVRTFTRHVGERPSGYGFVLFENVESAQRCIDGLKKYRNLHPSFSKQVHKIPGIGWEGRAEPKQEESIEESDSFKAKMERLADKTSTNLYIEGLPLSIDDAALAALVSPHSIRSNRFFQTKLSQPPRMIAFVRLDTREAAEDVIERLHGRMVRGWNDAGCRVAVRFADTAEQRELRRTEHRGHEGTGSPSEPRLTVAHASLLNLHGQDVNNQHAPAHRSPQYAQDNSRYSNQSISPSVSFPGANGHNNNNRRRQNANNNASISPASPFSPLAQTPLMPMHNLGNQAQMYMPMPFDDPNNLGPWNYGHGHGLGAGFNPMASPDSIRAREMAVLLAELRLKEEALAVKAQQHAVQQQQSALFSTGAIRTSGGYTPAEELILKEYAAVAANNNNGGNGIVPAQQQQQGYYQASPIATAPGVQSPGDLQSYDLRTNGQQQQQHGQKQGHSNSRVRHSIDLQEARRGAAASKSNSNVHARATTLAHPTQPGGGRNQHAFSPIIRQPSQPEDGPGFGARKAALSPSTVYKQLQAQTYGTDVGAEGNVHGEKGRRKAAPAPILAPPVGGYNNLSDSSPLAISPSLTYASRTPSTLSPATPFFGHNFNPLPAISPGEGIQSRQ